MGNEWIKCSDRMPDLNELVLVWSREGFSTALRYESKRAVDFEGYPRILWNVDNIDVSGSNYDIEFWMPLPAEPLE